MYRKIHVLRACLCYDVDGPLEIYSVLAVTTFWQSFAFGRGQVHMKLK